MAIKISGTNVINDARQLENITNLKTVNLQSILGVGDIQTSNYIMRVYTTPGTWEKPVNLKAAKITVVGGGGASGNNTLANISWPGAGAGGSAIKYADVSELPGPVTVTVGEGGNFTNPAALSGNTSFFGSICSATGGVTGRSLGAGGAGVGGTLNIQGESGGGSTFTSYSYTFQTTSPGPSNQGPITTTNPAVFLTGFRGKGGNSLLGFGGISGVSGSQGPPATSVVLAGVQGVGYGAGASGQVKSGSLFSITGANGMPGIVIVEEFY